MGKDGKPATFSKENVPYKPAHFLPVQPTGLAEGDLVFVVGYPGRTQRHQTYAEVKDTTDWSFPRFIKSAEEQIAILEALGKTDPELKIKAAGRVRGLNNSLTNRRGQLEGLVKGGILAKKEANEKALAAWIAADPARQKEYGDVLPALAALQAEADKTRERDAAFAGLFMSSSMLDAAHSAHLLSVEKAKKSDMDRELEYQERNWTRIREGQERAQRTIDARIDRALLSWAMGLVAALPADQRIAGLDKLVGLTAGHGEGRLRRRRLGLPRQALRRHEDGRQGLPPRAPRQDHRPDRRHAGHDGRPRPGPRPAVPGQPARRRRRGRAPRRAFARATCRPSSRSRAASSRRTPTARCASPSAP